MDSSFIWLGGILEVSFWVLRFCVLRGLPFHVVEESPFFVCWVVRAMGFFVFFCAPSRLLHTN